jgi:hypothetical protein
VDEGETPRRHPLVKVAPGANIGDVVVDRRCPRNVRAAIIEAVLFEQPKEVALEPAVRV